MQNTATFGRLASATRRTGGRADRRADQTTEQRRDRDDPYDRALVDVEPAGSLSVESELSRDEDERCEHAQPPRAEEHRDDDPHRRDYRRSVAALAAVAIVALVCVLGATQAQAATPSSAAALVAGQPVALSCVDRSTFDRDAHEAPGQRWAYGIAGATFWPDRHIELTEATCDALAALQACPRALATPTLAEALATFTLAHELGHVLDGPDEQAADRYGLVHASAVAYALGLRRRDQFARLADWIDAYGPLHVGVRP